MLSGNHILRVCASVPTSVPTFSHFVTVNKFSLSLSLSLSLYQTLLAITPLWTVSRGQCAYKMVHPPPPPASAAASTPLGVAETLACGRFLMGGGVPVAHFWHIGPCRIISTA